MPRFRPRISILTALLLITITGLAIVIAQLWREVGPLRAEVRRLRDETGRLYVEDKSKVHAIEIDTGDELTWKWRLWIPENRHIMVHVTGNKIPKQGFPHDNRGTIGLGEPGEQVAIYRIQRDPRNGNWYGSLQIGGASVGKYEQPWVEWPSRTSTGEGVGRQTQSERPGKPFVLIRRRISQVSDSTKIEDPAAGFMIWLEPSI